MEPVAYPVEVLSVPGSPTMDQPSSSRAFIEANILVASVDEVQYQHLIPVFVKDNEPLISHGDFISATMDAVSKVFRGEHILQLQVRVSHPIKGRIPDAKHKPVSSKSGRRRSTTNGSSLPLRLLPFRTPSAVTRYR